MAKNKIRLPFTFFLAFRYLQPKRTFLSLITLISIFGVAVGIWVPIVVLSVMTGFDREMQKQIIGFEAHINVRVEGNLMTNWREALAKIQKVPGVVAAAPTVTGPVIAEFHNVRYTPSLLGIDPDLQEKITNIGKFIVAGRLDLQNDDTCVVGSALANALGGLAIGDKLTIYSPDVNKLGELFAQAKDHSDNKALLDKIHQTVLPKELTVTGIFSTGRLAYDQQFVFVPLNTAQEAYALLDVGPEHQDAIHAIQVKTTDPFQAAVIRDRIEKVLGPSFIGTTWIEQNQDLMNALGNERVMMFIVTIVVVIVASFGIMSTLITTTVQKTREIGVMKALGAKVTQILWIFLVQGVIVGLIGTLFGLIGGILTIRHLNQIRDLIATIFHIELFPQSVYQFAQLPAELVPSDVAIICVSGFLICSIAALIPAYFAARLDPVKALRYE